MSDDAWARRQLRLLWAAQSISVTGTQLSRFTLPLLALTGLGLSAADLGLLRGLQSGGYLALGLVAGVLADTMPRRALVLASDLAQALVLGTIAGLAWIDALTPAGLLLGAFVMGCVGAIHHAAYVCYVPTLLPRAWLLTAHGRFESSRSVAEAVGPGLAGGLLVLWSMPGLLLLDVLSYLGAALLVTRTRPPALPGPATRPGLRSALAGLGVLRRHRVLRPLAASAMTFVFFELMLVSLLPFFLIHELQLSPTTFGLVLSAEGVGAIVGALAAPVLMRRYGLGRALLGSSMVVAIVGLGIPLASPGLAAAALLVGAVEAVRGFGRPLFNVARAVIEQSTIDPTCYGRVTGAMRISLGLCATLGPLMGAALASSLGVRPVLWIAAVGSGLNVVWLWRSDLRHIAVAADAAALSPLHQGSPS